MLIQLSSIFIEGDQARPGKTVTDKAYGRTQHFRPLHTCAELLQMQLLSVQLQKRRIEEIESQGYMHMLWDIHVFFYNLYTCVVCLG